MKQKFSILLGGLIISMLGMRPSGAKAVVDGMIQVTSSNEAVLKVTLLESGLFQVDFVGPGEAKLIATADADLSDDVATITQEFEFLIIDPSTQADHFELQIIDTLQHAQNQAQDDTKALTDAATDTAASG